LAKKNLVWILQNFYEGEEKIRRWQIFASDAFGRSLPGVMPGEEKFCSRQTFV
jgi:hypothetical protein